MAGLPQIGGVSTHGSAVRLEAQYQAQTLARQAHTVKDLGTAALNLIRALVSSDSTVGQNFDVIA